MTITRAPFGFTVINDDAENSVEAMMRFKDYGHLYDVDNTTVTGMTANTPTKVLGTTTVAIVSDSGDLVGTDNRWTWNGDKPTLFKFDCVVVADNPTDYITFEFSIYKNGTTVVPGSQVKNDLLETDYIRSTPITGMVELQPNDYIEIWIKNTENNNNTTMSELLFRVESI